MRNLILVAILLVSLPWFAEAKKRSMSPRKAKMVRMAKAKRAAQRARAMEMTNSRMETAPALPAPTNSAEIATSQTEYPVFHAVKAVVPHQASEVSSQAVDNETPRK